MVMIGWWAGCESDIFLDAAGLGTAAEVLGAVPEWKVCGIFWSSPESEVTQLGPVL